MHTLQHVGNSIVAHVDGGVRQRFHEPVLIPRQLGAKAVRPRALKAQ